MNKYFVKDLGIWGDSDRFIEEVLVGEEYKYLFDYDTVVDLGSNIGTFALWIYPYAKTIYAVEPNPIAMKMLEKTIEDNGLDKVTPVLVAITGSDEKRFLANTEDIDHGSGLINDTTGIIVQGMQMDTFMVQYNIPYIDLLKVDIEQSEQELFSSAGFANASSKIGTIIGEYHNGDIQQSIAASLTGLGYNYQDLTKAGSSGKFIARKL